MGSSNMRDKLKKNMKKFIAYTLIAVSVVSSTSTLIRANASTSILGTQAALGSPILNNNATTDSWNKWEIVCWGVYLSNFCQPLIDDYTSAFTTDSGGTNGAGYQALCFGTGSDQTNNEVIKDFTSYAVKVQKESTKKNVYVGYTEMKDGVLQTKIDPNDSDAMSSAGKSLRYATFNDFIFQKMPSSGAETMTCADVSLKSYTNYNKMLQITDGYIPTFYIQDANGKYVTILDYTNSWDIQAFAAIVNAVRTGTGGSKDYSKEFDQAFTDNMSSNNQVYMDCFANLMVNGKMLFPACNNRNITTDKSINIINSWLMNSYTSSISGDTMSKNLSSPKYSTFATIATILSNSSAFTTEQPYSYSGIPAFGGESSLDGQGIFYFDTDSIVNKDYADGTVNYGEAITKLFDQDISADNYKYNLKFEVAGAESNLIMSSFANNVDSLNRTTYMASLISDSVTSEEQPKVLDYIIKENGDKTKLLGDKAVAIAPMIGTAETDSGIIKNAEAVRTFYSWLYKVYTSGDKYNSTAGTIDVKALKQELSNCKSQGSLTNLSNELWKCFIADNPDYKNKKISNISSLFDFAGNESISSQTARLTVAYPVSSTMKQISSILRLEDGTEFGAYSAFIYMTYLDWYGVTNQSNLVGGTDSTSNFDKSVFDETSDIFKTTPDKISDSYKSKDDRDEEISQMTYLMLSPGGGREYRQEIIYNGIADFLYKQYNRIVYGGESSVTTGNTTKSNSGFLAVPTYSENMFTSWFLDTYVNIATVALGMIMLLIIIIGLLKKRKFSWYIICLMIAVNVILLVPTTGEITPYITSGFTQKIFSDKMTYWTLSEGITNAELENKASSKDSEITKEVLGWVSSLSSVYTDRTLMIKQDSSQKIVQKLDGAYSDIQSIKSARWVLPIVMQEFSAERQKNNEKYVYVKLSNMWDDGSNLYWYYKPDDANFVTKPTLTSKQFTDGSAETLGDKKAYGRASEGTGEYISKEYYTDYKNPMNWGDDKSTKVNYANYSYTLNDTLNDNVHTYAWVLHDKSLNMNSTLLKTTSLFGEDFKKYEGTDSWQTLMDTANSNLSGAVKYWQTTKDGSYGYENISGEYDRTDASTLKDGYGYYKTTESPYYYFFDVVKDSFPSNKVVGAVIGRLQGEMDKTDENDKKRNNFMYATTSVNKEHEDGYSVDNAESYTGDVRDVLDLQCFFTNTVPYMYKMTLVAGGFDGKTGLLGDSTISDKSEYYKGNLQSWAYRCNWAVKIMENSNYSKPAKARLADGTKVTIQNPLLPESYEAAGRQMVFSEAQKNALGLKDKDLTLVELKCIEVNKTVAEDWTLLINYANTDGLTKEVLFRVMATVATEDFCKEFSNSGIFDKNYDLYPQSIDLRYLSFDAIMKMLMVNISKNTCYAYGDTMDNLLNDSDLFTAFMLLLCSVLCVWIIPFAQQLIMAAIFYLGFIAIIRALFSSASYKAKIVGAQLVSNIMFMVYTLVYYGILGALMKLSSSSDVLTVDQIKATAGNPVWMFIIVVVVSGVYIFTMYKHLCFCFAHYRDMGLEVMGFVTSSIVGKLQDVAGNIVNGFNDFVGNESTGGGASSVGGTGSISGSGAKEQSNSVQFIVSDNSNVTVSTDKEKSTQNILDDTTVYSTGETVVGDDTVSADEINSMIKQGEKFK